MTKEQLISLVTNSLQQMLIRLQHQTITMGDILKSEAEKMIALIKNEWKEDGSN